MTSRRQFSLATAAGIAVAGVGPSVRAITGDIDAMWLRDSAAQVWPYLPLLRQDDALRRMVLGIVYRHALHAPMVRVGQFAVRGIDPPGAGGTAGLAGSAAITQLPSDKVRNFSPSGSDNVAIC
jgi:hypothetical protein